MQHQNLWAPWRMEYIKGLDPSPATGSPPGCFLCEAAKVKPQSEQAKQQLVLIQDERGVLMLNRFPYTNGHLLAAVGEHLGDLTDLSASQRGALFDLVAQGEQLLRDALNPQGINIGINVGRCAGAGVPGHLHVHIVPRWGGDANFMQVVGGVRVIPQALEESYSHLSEVLAGMKR